MNILISNHLLNYPFDLLIMMVDQSLSKIKIGNYNNLLSLLDPKIINPENNVFTGESSKI